MPPVQGLAASAAAEPAAGERRSRILDPLSRVSEVLFGVIMALTFTTTVDAATGGREEIRTLLFAALGCNLAWGLVDAVMFLMSALTERGRDVLTVNAVRDAATTAEAHRIISGALPPIVAAVLVDHDFERVRRVLIRLNPPRPRLDREDWLGALAVFLLVFLATLPIVVPFLLLGDARAALRASNAVALVMLFLCGYTLARHAGHPPWLAGLGMAVLGSVLVAITIALGG